MLDAVLSRFVSAVIIQTYCFQLTEISDLISCLIVDYSFIDIRIPVVWYLSFVVLDSSMRLLIFQLKIFVSDDVLLYGFDCWNLQVWKIYVQFYWGRWTWLTLLWTFILVRNLIDNFNWKWIWVGFHSFKCFKELLCHKEGTDLSTFLFIK